MIFLIWSGQRISSDLVRATDCPGSASSENKQCAACRSLYSLLYKRSKQGPFNPFYPGHAQSFNGVQKLLHHSKAENIALQQQLADSSSSSLISKLAKAKTKYSDIQETFVYHKFEMFLEVAGNGIFCIIFCVDFFFFFLICFWNFVCIYD